MFHRKRRQGLAKNSKLQRSHDRKTIEALIESARTGNHESSVRTITSCSVQFFIPENPRLIDVKTEGSNACESKPRGIQTLRAGWWNYEFDLRSFDCTSDVFPPD